MEVTLKKVFIMKVTMITSGLNLINSHSTQKLPFPLNLNGLYIQYMPFSNPKIWW